MAVPLVAILHILDEHNLLISGGPGTNPVEAAAATGMKEAATTTFPTFLAYSSSLIFEKGRESLPTDFTLNSTLLSNPTTPTA